MKLNLWIVTVMAALASCSQQDFTQLPDGSRYKLHKFGSDQPSSPTQWPIALSVKMYHQETLLLDSAFVVIPRDSSAFSLFLQKFQPGDSLSYISKNRLFQSAGLTAGDEPRYELMVLNPSASRQKIEHWMAQQLFQSIISTDSVKNNYKYINGIYFKSLNTGDSTKPVVPDAEVTIHYRGKILSGKSGGEELVFDDTRRMGKPFSFIYGKEGQVISGLEVALSLMHESQNAQVIIPSQLAFGSRAAAGGKVQPYATVLYSIEVISVNSRPDRPL